MNGEQAVAFVIAQTAMLNCRVQGMMAENAYRVSNGQSPAYCEDAFAALERQYEVVLGYNELLKLFQGG